jgi:hypothetical protein
MMCTHLQVILMSATINADIFVNYFAGLVATHSVWCALVLVMWCTLRLLGFELLLCVLLLICFVLLSLCPTIRAGAPLVEVEGRTFPVEVR